VLRSAPSVLLGSVRMAEERLEPLFVMVVVVGRRARVFNDSSIPRSVLDCPNTVSCPVAKYKEREHW